MKEKAIEITVGFLVAVGIGLGGWGLSRVVELEKAVASAAAGVDADYRSLRDDVNTLKGGPSRNEWNQLRDDVEKMERKVDRLLNNRGR